MKPVLMPMMCARVRPAPSFALKTFISRISPPPGGEMRQTPPSVRVPSTSMRKRRIFFARSKIEAEGCGFSGIETIFPFDLVHPMAFVSQLFRRCRGIERLPVCFRIYLAEAIHEQGVALGVNGPCGQIYRLAGSMRAFAGGSNACQ